MKKAVREKRKTAGHFNDLLLPVILVLCVLPFVVYLAEYDTGFSQHSWNSDYSIVQDFYTCYRRTIFLLVTAFTVVILEFRLGLYREKTKPVRLFVPLVVYSIFVALSAMFSKNQKASWLGGTVSFEGAFVLIGYCVMAFYTYQILESEYDYSSVMHAILVMFALISVPGWFQVFGHDLLNNEWVQRLVMPDNLFAEYGGQIEDLFTGNHVFLTLYNPNFAAIFLIMFSAVFAVFFISADNKKERILYGIFLVDAWILCWFTYTRAAIVALVVIAIAFFGMRHKNTGTEKKAVFLMAGAAVILFAVLFLADALGDGRYLSRILDQKKDDRLESIVTSQEGVTITYDGRPYLFAVENGSVKVQDAQGNEIELEETADGDFITPFSDSCYVNAVQLDAKEELVFLLDGYTLEFSKLAAGYYYETEWGKADELAEIPHANFHGIEYLGSGRLYIWSRILPMLKHDILKGSGPDTFAEVFPQNDYVGKMIYAESTGRIMERAHNDFLAHWVQTGLLSPLALLVFYVLFFRKTIPYYRNCEFTGVKNKLGFGGFLGCVGYLVCCMFSDSTLYTTPAFYVFLGIALAAV